MEKKYKKMLTPYRLTESITLKNRITFANGQHGMTQGPEKYPSEAMLTEITDLCSSGASLISFHYFDGKHGGGANARRDAPETIDRSHIPLMDMDDPAVQNYMCQVPALAHMYGSKALIKLGPCWPRGTTYGGGDARSLMPIDPDSEFLLPPAAQHPMTIEEMKARICPKEKIKDVIQELVVIAKRCKAWGFDGMNFRCDRFLDADTNLREDEYGGEIENRGRFLYELFKAVKEEVGQDFIIEVCMPGKQDHGGDGELRHGYTLEELIRFLKMSEDYIDIAQMREETGPGYHPTGYCSQEHVHESLNFCRALREAGVNMAISACGGFGDPDDIEEALESGVVDLISATRLFIAEPNFLKKICGRTTGRPTPCIECNKCHGLGENRPWIPVCSVNPQTSMRHRMSGIVKPPLEKKNVAVIGGGPIGMRTAIFAAEAGHEITIYEKTGRLGGKMLHSEYYSFKWPMKRYLNWLRDEVERLGITVHLNVSPDPEQLSDLGYDAVIACTGSVAKRPPVEGACADGIWTIDDVIAQRLPDGQRVVMVGGAESATDTAMYLAECGKDITVLTRDTILMRNQLRPHAVHWAYPHIDPELGYGGTSPAWAKYKNMHPIYEATTTKVTPNSVTYIKDGQEYTIECDLVIVNGGYEPCIEEALRYTDCAPMFMMAGDVEGKVSSNIQTGNVSAWGKASAL